MKLFLLACLLLSISAKSQNKFVLGQANYQTHVLSEMTRTPTAYTDKMIIKTIPNSSWVVCYGYGDTSRKANNQWIKVVYEGVNGYAPISAFTFDFRDTKLLETFRVGN